MTVSTTTCEIEYVESAGATYPVPFRFLQNSDLRVLRRQVGQDDQLLTYATDYSVTGAGNELGGSITRISAASVGARLIIYRETEELQPTNYTDGDRFPAESHERGLDRVTLIAQETQARSDRALAAPIGETIGRVPFVGQRAGRTLAFDSNGNPVVGPEVGQLQQLLGVIFNPAFTQLAALVLFTALGTGAMARSVNDRLRETVSVKDFGAIGDGLLHTVEEWIVPGALGRYSTLAALQAEYPHVTATSDAIDWAAAQQAINYFSGGNGRVITPGGHYVSNRTLSMVQHRITFKGAGKWATRWEFQPAANDIALFVGKGGEGSSDGGLNVQSSIQDMTFFSYDTTYKKTAIELKDVSELLIKNVVVGTGSTWNTNGSIGLRTRGREKVTVRGCEFYADQPLVFARNDNFPSITADHFHFQDLTLRCSSTTNFNYSCVFFEPGTNFSNMTFDGSQVWLRGKNGLLLDNSGTSAAGAGYVLNLCNVRWEGEPGENDTGYFVDIDFGPTGDAYHVAIEKCYSGEIGQGVRLRAFVDASIDGYIFASTTRKALDIDVVNGQETLTLTRCFWQSGATASIGASFRLLGAQRSLTTSPLPRSGTYVAGSLAGQKTDYITGGPLNQQPPIVVAAADPTVVTLPLRSTYTGFVVLSDSRGKVALVRINSVSKATTIALDDGTWSNTLDTLSKLNVYWDAASSTYRLQNKTGISRDLYVQALGSNQ